jgi:hypothetical protein
MTLTIEAKALGHFSPYGSYWAAMSLLVQGADVNNVEKFVAHVEKWSLEHTLLRPRVLHLRAELACRSDVDEVLLQNSSQIDSEAIKLFDQASSEAERQSLLDCAAFINERLKPEYARLMFSDVPTF